MSLFGGLFKGLGSLVGIAAAPFTGGASLIPSLITGGASLIGGAMQNSSAKSIATNNNAASIELANTAHQREVRDMMAAGLNPILSAGGKGAATPSMQAAPVQNIVPAAVQAALQTATAKAQIDNLRETNEQIKAQTKLVKSQERKTTAEADHFIDNMPQLSKQLMANAASAQATADSSRVAADADMMSGATLKAIANGTGTAAQLAKFAHLMRGLTVGGK